MNNILGVSAFVHDSAACLVQNGRIVLNVEEERLNRLRHTNLFPLESIRYILNETGVKPSDIDCVAFSWKPCRLLFREFGFALKYLPLYYLIQKYCNPSINFKSIRKMFKLKQYLKEAFGERFNNEVKFVHHHLSHAASSYYLSSFNESDILVVDGYGGGCSTSLYKAYDKRIDREWGIQMKNSIGIVYRNFTKYLGFDDFQEGALVALSSYGNDTFKDFFDRCFVLKTEGRYHINRHLLGYWSYMRGYVFKQLGPPRRKGEPITQKHKDIANSLQNGIKKVILHVLEYESGVSDNKNLCLSGGCFLNCDVNSEIVDRDLYGNIYVPPFTSNSGGAAGAALYTSFKYFDQPRDKIKLFSPYIGPSYTDQSILETIKKSGYPFYKPKELHSEVSHVLMENKIIGWFQGRVECGPRALGDRSILASPFDVEIKNRLNEIKNRASFRPFAPVVTFEGAKKYFDINEPYSSLLYYMLMTVKVKEDYQEALSAVIHLDNTARIQIVTEDSNKNLYLLLKEFEEYSGYPILLNTSFNIKEPMVCTPEDAMKTFENSKLDGLVIGEHCFFR